jgi:Uma2 family endonuclease
MTTTVESLETIFISEREYTQSEFAEWLDDRPPSDINHYELLNGRIVMTPPAGWPHGHTENKVQFKLTGHVNAHHLGIVLGSSTGYDLPTGDTVEPDVSFIGSERFQAGPEPEQGKFLRIVPNLVVEILSPATRKRDLTEKKDVYARAGVDEYWIVDSAHREITLFHLAAAGLYDEGRVLRATELLVSRAVAGFSCQVGDLF